MMNKRWMLPLILSLAAWWMFSSILAASGEKDGFTIESADGTVYRSASVSAELIPLINNVLPRYIIEFANQKVDRRLVPPPGEMAGLIGSVSDRFVIEFANGNRVITLPYPEELIDDEAPPAVTSVGASTVTDTSIKITWVTAEYTTSTVDYGPQPGAYTGSVSDPIYRTAHALTISGLTAGIPYYYQITSTDRSGNTGVSAEYSFEVLQIKKVYVPVIIKK